MNPSSSLSHPVATPLRLDTYLAVSHLKNVAESFSVSPSASISIALELLLDSLGHLIQTLCGGIRLE